MLGRQLPSGTQAKTGTHRPPTVRHRYIQTSRRPAKVKKVEASKPCLYKVTQR